VRDLICSSLQALQRVKTLQRACQQNFPFDAAAPLMAVVQAAERELAKGRGNKNLAIANRSRVSCINTNNNTMTLKSGLEVTQGH